MILKLNNEELFTVNGGASITGTLINAFARGINSLLDLGRSLGSAVRRIITGSMCEI